MLCFLWLRHKSNEKDFAPSKKRWLFRQVACKFRRYSVSSHNKPPTVANQRAVSELYFILWLLYKLAVVAAIVHVLVDNRQPALTMAWALVIYFVPVAGILLYIFFGINTRRERVMSRRSLNQLSRRTMLGFIGQDDFALPERYNPMAELFINQNFALPFKDTVATPLTDGHAFFLDLLRAIGAARHHIHVDLYIFDDDPLGRLVADALVDKARQGVEVRVVYDDVGCWRVPSRFFERMREEGVEVCPFLPVRFPTFTGKVNYRNHRKLFVIDGTVGFIGGMNVALRYVKGEGGQPWRDTMVRLEGSAVYGLQRAFLIDWYFVDRTLISDRRYYPPLAPTAPRNACIAQVVTSSPVTPYPEIMQGYVRLILSARTYIYIETPYFLPTEPVLFALKTAALGGVDVRVMVPLRGNAHFIEWASRSYLREMAEAGVGVHLYEGGFLHSKLMVCDDAISTCGSTNMDFRSFENNFEGNAFFYDAPTARRFRAIFEADLAQARPLADFPGRLRPKPAARLWESLTRLLAPLL